MKIKKLLIMLPIVFLCGEEFRNTYKIEKEAEKYKKVRDHCQILQVGIEVVQSKLL